MVTEAIPQIAALDPAAPAPFGYRVCLTAGAPPRASAGPGLASPAGKETAA
jgi:hypothetical protein